MKDFTRKSFYYGMLERMSEALLFHEDTFERTPIYGAMVRSSLQSRAVAVLQETESITDPDVSVVIRTRNDINSITNLIGELKKQLFDGDLEIILVDTESTDGTVEEAINLGARIVPIKQSDFNYPRALNLGFDAASNPYVVSLVGHSKLVSNTMLRGITRWQDERLGGVYGVTLPDSNATWTERIGALLLGVPRLVSIYEEMHSASMGLMAANCSAVHKKVWEELGGYDEKFGAGGEDGELGRRMMESGWLVIREPVLSVYHTHGLGPVDGYNQWKHWKSVERGALFDEAYINNFRPDLRKKSQ